MKFIKKIQRIPAGLSLEISKDGKNIIYKEKRSDKTCLIDIETTKILNRAKTMNCPDDICVINIDSEICIVGGKNEITLLEMDSLHVVARIRVVGIVRGICVDASQSYLFTLVEDDVFRFNIKSTPFYTDPYLKGTITL